MKISGKVGIHSTEFLHIPTLFLRRAPTTAFTLGEGDTQPRPRLTEIFVAQFREGITQSFRKELANDKNTVKALHSQTNFIAHTHFLRGFDRFTVNFDVTGTSS